VFFAALEALGLKLLEPMYKLVLLVVHPRITMVTERQERYGTTGELALFF